MASEFKIGEYNYRNDNMDAMTQFHVVRRIAPIFEKFREAILSSKEVDADMLGPIAEALAEMSDENSEYIISRCLAVVQREQRGGGGWAKIWNLQANRPMFDDIDMATMLQVTFRVIMDSLGPFSAALPQKLNEVAQASRSQR